LLIMLVGDRCYEMARVRKKQLVIGT